MDCYNINRENIFMHINTYKYILSHTYIDAYKYMVNEDANWLGCGGRRSEHYRRCWEGIVETLALTVIVTPKVSQVARLCTTATGVARPLRNQKFESYRINCSDNSQFLSCLFVFIATQKSL